VDVISQHAYLQRAIAANAGHVGEDERIGSFLPGPVVLAAARDDAALDDAVLEETRSRSSRGVRRRRPGWSAPAALCARARNRNSARAAVDVSSLDGVLHALQPVARQVGEADVAPDVLPYKGVVAGEKRRRLESEICEDEATQLVHRVGEWRMRSLKLLSAGSAGCSRQ